MNYRVSSWHLVLFNFFKFLARFGIFIGLSQIHSIQVAKSKSKQELEHDVREEGTNDSGRSVGRSSDFLKYLFIDVYLSVYHKSDTVLDTKENDKLNQAWILSSECLKDH